MTEIHLAAVALIVFLALLAVRERRRAEKELPVAHPHWPIFAATVAVYALVDAGLVIWAA